MCSPDEDPSGTRDSIRVVYGPSALYRNQPGKFIVAIRLHCLHGTLQSPGVWTGLEQRLSAGAGRPVRVVAEPIVPPASGGMESWAADFCAKIAGERLPPGDARVLLGYSLGGRLAMHVLARCPDRWVSAILVAAHPGGDAGDERAAIRARDRAWAARCRGEPLDAVLADWDALPIFAGRPNRAPRSPGELDPERQARILESFSRGRQSDLRERLAETALPPVLYLTGSDDVRYSRIGRELAERIPALRHEVVRGAGHRVPWDRPDAFAAAVNRFLAAP